jgi:hypothetical protein
MCGPLPPSGNTVAVNKYDIICYINNARDEKYKKI